MGRRVTVAALAVGVVAIGAAAASVLGRSNDDEQERSLDLFIGEAQRQIDLQYDTGSARDVKTLGLVAGALATIAVVVALRHGWTWEWVVPVSILVVASLCFLRSFWDQGYERGISLEETYKTFRGTLLQAKAAFLSDLLGAIRHNDLLLPVKDWWYAAGCWMLLLAFLVAIPIWIHAALGLQSWSLHG